MPPLRLCAVTVKGFNARPDLGASSLDGYTFDQPVVSRGAVVRRVIATSLTAAAALLTAVGAAAQEMPRPLVSFSAPDPWAIGWADIKRGATVEVFNDSTEDLELTFRPTAFRRDQPAERLAADKVVAVTPASAKVAAGDSIELKLRAAASATKPATGTYRGSLVAFDSGGQAFARRIIDLDVAGTPTAVPAAAKPLVDTLTVTVYRNRWGAGWHAGWISWASQRIDWDRYLTPNDVVVPLSTKSADVALPADKQLGAVRHGGRVATVAWTGSPLLLDNGMRGIKVGFKGLDEPGEYEGKLDLLPDDDKAGDVTLKVVYSDFIWLPLIVVFGGVLTGWAITHAVGVSVRYFDLRTRLGLMWRAFERAHKAFADASAGKSWAGYDITLAVGDERQRLREQIESLRASYAASIPDSKVEAVVTQVDEARETVDTLPAFAKQLQALDEAVTKIKTDRPEPQTDFPAGVTPAPLPAVIAELDPLLAGASLTTLGEYQGRKSAVDAAVSVTGKWLRLREAIRMCQARIEDLRPDIAPSQQSALDGAEDDLSVVLDRLWRSDRPVDDEPALREALDAVWADLGEIATQIPPPGPEPFGGALFELVYADLPPEEAGATAIAVGAEPLAPPPTADAAPPPPAVQEDEPKTFAALRDGLAWLLVAVAFAIAIVTGLNSQYVGKAFGASDWDYINLFVWGVTTKVVLDLVVSSLGALSLVRLPRV